MAAGQGRVGDGFYRNHRDCDESHRGAQITEGPGKDLGGLGAVSSGTIIRANGRVEHIQSKVETVLMKEDHVILVTPGGGGYGNPRDRNRALVAADVANGKISLAAARDVYGFVVTPDSGTA